MEDLSEETILKKVGRMQDELIARATGGHFDGGDPAYKKLRSELREQAEVWKKLPEFVRRCTNLEQFWQSIAKKYGSYAERRKFLWDSFHPAIEHLESVDRAPGLQPIDEAIKEFDADNVHAAWRKALDRRTTDPDGAITAARTLLESVCKHVLDRVGVEYAESDDLPKLWRSCAGSLNLAPRQHEEELFKTILGNCQSVVNSLGALRNKIGDAHGSGRRAVRPKPRHAELAVNLAGAMASFLVSTWKERMSQPDQSPARSRHAATRSGGRPPVTAAPAAARRPR